MLPEITWDDAASDESLINFVDKILSRAAELSASDIHIEPSVTHSRVRYRIDGLLKPATQMPKDIANRVIMRLKIMANLDIAEKRLPQDGRILLKQNISVTDIRINVCPVMHGEKIVLRLLDIKRNLLDIHHLGFNSQQKDLFINKVTQPQGLILVTGPTGSGKTTTLYSALNYLNHSEKNIITIEDPIEIQLEGINQATIHPKIGFDFASALRAFLRQDPDVIMIGEIRDKETAEIAIQAALTGHLVLSTLHANSAIESLYRLITLGCPVLSLANSLSLIINQRLLRKKCHHCQAGCTFCQNGYSGRTAIFECLALSGALSQQIINNQSYQELQHTIMQDGFLTLAEAGYEKIAAKETDSFELTRVLQH
ncbi:MAG TPA: GspE/PulE family protein [Gammaproteobacteria bacterium]|nr:GspE/PulE family protein [Gammaproteobacteria bacterium]